MKYDRTWAHLPNAALIDAVIAAAPRYKPAARDAARDAAWDAARAAARAAARWNAATSIIALVAWDDMPAYIAMSNDELNALRAVANGTNTAHKAFCALIYKDITA